jgi:ubiquinone/menaquinone biosynthesis C-methylase UbiE
MGAVSSTVAGTELWDAWARRWRSFQEAYVPDRERQLDVMAECVALVAGGRAGTILDLASGAGSVADAVLERCPELRAVAVDLDPWLIELGRQTARAADRIEWVEADLRDPRWVTALPGDGYVAVTCATALHWLRHPEVRRLYYDARRLMIRDGILVVADVMPVGSPRLRRLARAAAATREAATGERWDRFWAEVRAVPEFGPIMRERSRRQLVRPPCVSLALDAHVAALTQAGFGEAGEVWRVHEAAAVAAFAEPDE